MKRVSGENESQRFKVQTTASEAIFQGNRTISKGLDKTNARSLPKTSRIRRIPRGAHAHLPIIPHALGQRRGLYRE